MSRLAGFVMEVDNDMLKTPKCSLLERTVLVFVCSFANVPSVIVISRQYRLKFVKVKACTAHYHVLVMDLGVHASSEPF